jgi:hypothetical protein
VRLRIPQEFQRAARRADLKSIKARLTVRATYADGRRALKTRTVRIRL